MELEGARPGAGTADGAVAASAIPPRPMILLDTNAVLYLIHGHRRARGLSRHAGHLGFSPFALLELAFLREAGRGRFTSADPLEAVMADPRWTVDDPPTLAVVRYALGLRWTRDPFDRLLAAHALFRGWRIATSDATMLSNMPASATLEL